MYAQTTLIRVPMGLMPQMREVIRREYLPQIREREGFVSAFLLEQVDDPDRAELVILWESQDAVERFNSTGHLAATVHGLAASLPEADVRRQGYALTVSAGMLTGALEPAVVS